MLPPVYKPSLNSDVRYAGYNTRIDGMMESMPSLCFTDSFDRRYDVMYDIVIGGWWMK